MEMGGMVSETRKRFLVLAILCTALWISVADAYVLSGTVANNSGKTGRTYLFVNDSRGFGSSIDSAGAFSISGVPPGTYTVTAVMDTRGDGKLFASDPIGVSASFTVTTQDKNDIAISMSNPAPPTPPTPSWLTVYPGSGFAGVRWDIPANSSPYLPIADHYNLYWSTSPGVAPGNTVGGGSRTGIKHPGYGPFWLTGLADGATHYFVVTATVNGAEGSPSPVYGPVTIGSPSGGVTVQGTINLSGVTPTGPLFVGLWDGLTLGKGQYIPSPTGSQPFQIDHVPDGLEMLYVVLDNTGDAVENAGDLSSDFADLITPPILVQGAPLSGVTMNLPAGNGRAGVFTEFQYPDSYALFFMGKYNRRLITNMTVMSGPGVSQAIDVPWDDGWFDTWSLPLSGRPNVGDSYAVKLRFAGGTVETPHVAITAVLDGYATPLYPSGTISGTVPVLTWAPPSAASALVPVQYKIYVSSDSGKTVWKTSVGGNRTSLTYNEDGTAKALVSGAQYYWWVVVKDQHGNRSVGPKVGFTPNAAVRVPVQYTASGTYTYSSSTQLLSFNMTDSNFVCDGPTTGAGSKTVTSLTATTQVWQEGDGEQTWTRSGGTDGVINGVWNQTDPATGSAYTMFLAPDGTLLVIGNFFSCHVDGAPTIASFTPASGMAGNLVTISGANFSPIASDNTVLFNGTPAVVTGVRSQQLSVLVPVGATSGKVSVATYGGSAASGSSFTVTAGIPAVTLSWGGVHHRFDAVGAQYDALNVGTSSYATTLAGMSLTASGPGGFSYAFTDADIVPSTNGRLAVYKKYPTPATPLAPGLYTFTLDDGHGHVSQTAASHGAVTVPMPRVDVSTIQYRRKADGSYRFSWAAPSDARGCFYFLRICRNDAANTIVYDTAKGVASFADVPVGILFDESMYNVRVLAVDAPDVSQETSRTDSSARAFCPKASDPQFQPDGSIAGVVSDGSGTPLGNIAVTVFDLAGGSVNSARTGGNGAFTIAVPPGSYKVSFDPRASGYFIAEWFNNKGAFAEADQVTALSGQTSTANAGLAVGGKVSGRVTDGAGNGIPYVGIGVYDLSGNPTGYGSGTDSNGYYGVNLPPGSYKLNFCAFGYSCKAYDNKTSLNDASPVTVVNGQTTPNIDAQLSRSYALWVTLAGTGSGSVNSNPAGIACTSGTCWATYGSGTPVTLMKLPGGTSTFAGWSGECTGTTGDCVVNMTADKAVTATFSAAPKATIGTTGFPSLAAAYAVAAENDVIMLLDGELSEALTFNRGIPVILRGGYRPDFTARSGNPTTLKGPVALPGGKVTVDRVAVQ